MVIEATLLASAYFSFFPNYSLIVLFSSMIYYHWGTISRVLKMYGHISGICFPKIIEYVPTPSFLNYPPSFVYWNNFFFQGVIFILIYPFKSLLIFSMYVIHNKKVFFWLIMAVLIWNRSAQPSCHPPVPSCQLMEVNCALQPAKFQARLIRWERSGWIQVSMNIGWMIGGHFRYISSPQHL